MSRSWTSQDDWMLIGLCERGVPLAQIARKLDRTKIACTRRMTRLKIRRVQRPQGCYTSNGIAELLGKKSTTVVRWMRQAGLPHRKVYNKETHSWHYRVDSLELELWLSHPVNWHRYDLEKITDVRWETMLREVQQTTTYPYLTIAQIAERYCVSPYTVEQWVSRKKLTNCNSIRGFALIHQDELTTFTPPHVNPAKRKNKKT